MSNTLIDGKIVAQTVLGSLKQQLPLLSKITTDFSTEAANKATTISVGVATAATAQTFGGSYASILNNITLTEKSLTMGEPLVAVAAISDTEAFKSDARVMENQAKELAYALAKKIVSNVHDVVTTGNYTNAEVKTAANHNVDFIAELSSTADTAGYGMERAFVISPAAKTAILKDDTLQAQAAFQEVVRGNEIGNIFGFDVISYPGFDDNSQNLVSYTMDKSAIIAAARLPKVPEYAVGVKNEVVVDEDSGLPMLFKIWYDNDSRQTYMAAELHFSVGVGNAAALRRITSS